MSELKKEIETVIGGLKGIKEVVSSKVLGVDYVSICALALELLEQVLGEEYSFPVDIDTIVRELGIEVIYQPLEPMRNEGEKPIHRQVGTSFIRPKRADQKPISCIWIDSESRQEEQRYALAHELAHCLINQDCIYSSAYYLMPMLFKDMEEMVADIFAIFLLIPIPAFFEIFYEYIKVQTEPVRTREWLTYLGFVANIPYEEVAIGYQNMRYVSGIIYELRDQRIELEKNVEEFVSPDVKNIVMKHFKKIAENISDEMEELLYL